MWLYNLYLDRMELINGDCLEVMKDLSDNIAQVFFCDLPYGQVACKWDTPIDLSAFWKEALRIGKDNCVYCFTATMKFANVLINSNPKMFRYDCTIIKTNVSNPLLCSFRHMNKHETLLVFYKKKPKWRRDKYHTRSRSFVDKLPQEEEGCFNRRTSPCIPGENMGKRWDPVLPTTVLFQTSRVGRSIHPTRKDPKMIKDLLKYWTDEGDIVIDPTAGSGSTGEACKELGLHFIGIEKDPKWFEVCKERLEKIF